MNVLSQAFRDSNGDGDIANITIFLLVGAAVVLLGFMAGMGAVDYFHCINVPTTTIAKGPESVTSIVPCRYDPLPLGQASGLVFAAFSALITALGGYIKLARERAPDGPPGA